MQLSCVIATRCALPLTDTGVFEAVGNLFNIRAWVVAFMVACMVGPVLNESGIPV